MVRLISSINNSINRKLLIITPPKLVLQSNSQSDSLRRDCRRAKLRVLSVSVVVIPAAVVAFAGALIVSATRVPLVQGDKHARRLGEAQLHGRSDLVQRLLGAWLHRWMLRKAKACVCRN